MMPSTMDEHNEWTIRVSPRHSGLDHKWRALVEIWRPDREPSTHTPTVVPFARTAADERAVIAVALTAARAYIDAFCGITDGRRSSPSSPGTHFSADD